MMWRLGRQAKRARHTEHSRQGDEQRAWWLVGEEGGVTNKGETTTTTPREEHRARTTIKLLFHVLLQRRHRCSLSLSLSCIRR
jgi:hypothetical protein